MLGAHWATVTLNMHLTIRVQVFSTRITYSHYATCA